MPILTTPRLRLEPYADHHLAGLNAMNSDPEVMRYLSGQPETPEETRASIERIKRRWNDIGYSWWSFIERASGEVVGAGCIQNLKRQLASEPDPACPLEIGWRLRRDRWNQGFATEAARAMGDFAFGPLRADELFAVCKPANTASAKVMQKLGMQHLGLQSWYGQDVTTYRTTAAEWPINTAGTSARGSG